METRGREVPNSKSACLQVHASLEKTGLFFGCQEPGEDRIEPVPTGYARDSASVSLRMKNLGAGKVAFDPYPFDRRNLKVQMRGKRLPQPRYSDEAAFRKAWYQAPGVMLEFELV